jgi:hypothetical protein
MKKLSLLNEGHVIFVSIGFYVASLFQDCVYVYGSDPRAWVPGWCLLLWGWIGLIFAGYVAWMANPLLCVSWFLIGRKYYKISLYFSLLAFVLMLSFLFYGNLVTRDDLSVSKISGYGYGYFFWLLSSFVLVVAGAFKVYHDRATQ